MKYLLCMLGSLLSSDSSHVIFDFGKKASLENWYIVDDVVMGGRSSGAIDINGDGHGVFRGDISLENNGGFSSLRHSFESITVKAYTKIVIKLKGDGRDYQFRIKSNARDYYSYIAPFSTSGEWEEVEIALHNMYPSFRGRRLDQPNFAHDHIEEIRFLIGNKKKESFELLIDKVELK